jgi:hypothetical protein
MDLQKLVFHTYDGFISPPHAPTLSTVALCLCRETRYCGNSPRWWNVGLHSFVVADMLPPELKFHGLVHDEPECITGDTPHDLKTKKQRAFEDFLLERFYIEQGVKLPTAAEHKQVKDADRLAVNAEVWADCGTACLRDLYSITPAMKLVEHYRDMYSYADCLEPGGAAVMEFCRRFEEYKLLVI